MVEGLSGVETITFFVEDRPSASRFDEQVFGLKAIFEDSVSAVFRFGSLMINLLLAGEAPGLRTPLRARGRGGGPRPAVSIPGGERGGERRPASAVDDPWGERGLGLR